MAEQQSRWLNVLFALVSGVLFGLGLAISGMANPAKVLGFLDVAGAWDPTLLFVMLGALAVTTPAFRLVLKRPAPWLDARFSLPTRNEIDVRLILGASLFGIGWGLGGLCPGPAIIDLVSLQPAIVVFVAAMLAGAWLYDRIDTAPRPRISSIN